MKWFGQTRVQAVLVVAFAWLIYLNALPGDFYFDDFHHVRDNLSLQVHVSISRFFTDPQTFSDRVGVKMYRPLTMLSYALTFALFGDKPIGFHLGNLLLHSLNALLVFLLGRRWLKDPVWSLLLALAFAAATINSMAVNYISSRSDLLAAGFVLLALFLDPGPDPADAPPRRLAAAGAMLSLALGLLCKENVVILPLLLLARDLLLFPGARWWLARRVGTYLAQAVIVAAYLALRYLLLGMVFGHPARPFSINLPTQLEAVWIYLGKIFFPVHLSILPNLGLAHSLFQPAVMAAALSLLGLLILAVRVARRLPLVTLGLAWFLLSLLPTSLPPLHVIISEPRVYLGSVGILLAACSLLARVVAPASRRWHQASWALLGLIILAQVVLTWHRNRLWQDGERLWAEATYRAPDLPFTLTQLGALAQERNHWDRAFWLFHKAWSSAPEEPFTIFSMGKFYADSGQTEPARPLLEKYVKEVEVPGEKVRGLTELARLELKAAQLGPARDRLQEALTIAPEDPTALFLLGVAAESEHHFDAAEGLYRRALVASPRFPEAEARLGTVLAQLGRYDQAETYLEQALAHGSQDAQALVHLGNLYAMQGRLEEAKDMMDRALEHNPDYAVGHLNRGVIHFRRKEFLAAEKEYREALRLDPSLLNAHNNLAILYLQMVQQKNLGARTPAQALALAREEIQWLKEHGVSTAELEKARQDLEGKGK